MLFQDSRISPPGEAGANKPEYVRQRMGKQGEFRYFWAGTVSFVCPVFGAFACTVYVVCYICVYVYVCKNLSLTALVLFLKSIQGACTLAFTEIIIAYNIGDAYEISCTTTWLDGTRLLEGSAVASIQITTDNE